MTSHRVFPSMDDAFDYCRELDKPVVVWVMGDKLKLYPSGRAEQLIKGTNQSNTVAEIGTER